MKSSFLFYSSLPLGIHNIPTYTCCKPGEKSNSSSVSRFPLKPTLFAFGIPWASLMLLNVMRSIDHYFLQRNQENYLWRDSLVLSDKVRSLASTGRRTKEYMSQEVHISNSIHVLLTSPSCNSRYHYFSHVLGWHWKYPTSTVSLVNYSHPYSICKEEKKRTNSMWHWQFLAFHFLFKLDIQSCFSLLEYAS